MIFTRFGIMRRAEAILMGTRFCPIPTQEERVLTGMEYQDLGI